jgi:hypothetical protein
MAAVGALAIQFCATASSASLLDDLRVVSLYGNSQFSESSVWTGKFEDIAGQQHDTSHLYEPENPHLSVGATILQEYSAQMYFVHDFYGHTGYQSPLFAMDPELQYSLEIVRLISPRTSLSIAVDNLISIGGDIEERPCFDSFSRAYHCGTGLPWKDSGEFHIEKSDTQRAFVEMIIRF